MIDSHRSSSHHIYPSSSRREDDSVLFDFHDLNVFTESLSSRYGCLPAYIFKDGSTSAVMDF